MSTHDMDLLNASGSAFRQDLNLALKALASNSSNAGDPTTLYDNQFYADTGDGIFKIRNAANSGFIDLFNCSIIITHATLPRFCIHRNIICHSI